MAKNFSIFLEVQKSLFLWCILLNLEVILAKVLNAQQGAKDYREQLDIGTEKDALNWNLNSPLWQRLEGPNLWPSEIPELKKTFLTWHKQTKKAC